MQLFFVYLNSTTMKFRIARKILFGYHWTRKMYKIDRYKPYRNAIGTWTYPSWHTHPVKAKAIKVYSRHKKRNKRRINSL